MFSSTLPTPTIPFLLTRETRGEMSQEHLLSQQSNLIQANNEVPMSGIPPGQIVLASLSKVYRENKKYFIINQLASQKKKPTRGRETLHSFYNHLDANEGRCETYSRPLLALLD